MTKKRRPRGISSRRRLGNEMDLQETSGFLEKILEFIPHPFYVIDAETCEILHANPSAKTNFKGGEKLDPSLCYSATHGNERPCPFYGEACPLDIVKKSKRSVILEHVHILPDGSRRNVEVHGHPLPDESGQVRRMLEYTIDVTEYKKMQEEIVQISSREQERIGQDLHDNLGQLLTGMGFMTKAIENNLKKKNDADAADVGTVSALIKEALLKTRAISTGLAPISSEGRGLSSALMELAASTQTLFGLPCRAKCSVQPNLDETVATHLYRIAQEAVTNAVKHAKALTVSIGMSRRKGSLILTVSDDGKGITARRDKGGLGLRSMRHRAEVIGGRLDIARGPGGGTVITCVVPLGLGRTNRGCGDHIRKDVR